MRPVISGCLLFCIFTNKYSACPKISSHVGDGSTPRAKTRPTNCEPTAERQSHSTAAAEVKRERSLPLPISTHLAPHFSTNVAAQSVCRGRGERWWRPYAPTTSPKLLSWSTPMTESPIHGQFSASFFSSLDHMFLRIVFSWELQDTISTWDSSDFSESMGSVFGVPSHTTPWMLMFPRASYSMWVQEPVPWALLEKQMLRMKLWECVYLPTSPVGCHLSLPTVLVRDLIISHLKY